mmetsp:Transcript_18564/g.32295  ORF Transcript_18564/g.32295 Transcript_18564/m.32295 type:complete len:224 (+) Transcript_18564:141-812(+)
MLLLSFSHNVLVLLLNGWCGHTPYSAANRLHVCGCIPSKGPDREQIAVCCVCDATRAVENAADALLGPISGRLLFSHQVLHATLHSPDVFAFPNHKCKQCPGSCYNSGATCAILLHSPWGVILVVARPEILTPASIVILLLKQEMHGLSHRLGIGALSCCHEAFHTKPGRISKAACPRAVPRAIRSLNALDKLTSEFDSIIDFLLAVVRVHAAESTERLHAGR